MSAREPATRRTPWRDNIEALAVAIIMAVMFKYFALEAYQIPTGSMQPTLMGEVLPDGGEIKDRILVDKLSFHYRDPERFEVVVFKYPLNRAQNFVKRLVGMPGEQLHIANGDLWRRSTASEPWQILRRPRAVQEDQWKAIDIGVPIGGQHWVADSGSKAALTTSERAAEVSADASMRFVANGDGEIRDVYTDGYPERIRNAIRLNVRTQPVGDVRATGRIRARAGLKLFTVVLTEGQFRYEFQIPGPAARDDATTHVVVTAIGDKPSGHGTLIQDNVGTMQRLRTNEWVRFSAQNLDDRLTLRLDGAQIAEFDIAAVEKQSAASVHLKFEGEGASLDDLQVWRDIFYTTDGLRTDEWTIPSDSYMMFGDNTQNSSDSRMWQRLDKRWRGMPPDRTVIGGNNRPNFGRASAINDANPVETNTELGPTTFFRDEWGELYTFATKDEQSMPPDLETSFAPLVQRKLIVGRAVAVFWPWSWSYRTLRLKWVR